MWYTGRTDADYPPRDRVFFATSLDGLTWTKYDAPEDGNPTTGDPVLTWGDAWESRNVATPWVVRVGNQYQMWYYGHGPEWNSPEAWIGFAVSEIPLPPVDEPNAYVDYLDNAVQDVPIDDLNVPAEDAPDLLDDFTDLFGDVQENIVEENYAGALEKLTGIRDDVEDYILDVATQQQLIEFIDDLIAYLQTLM
jgi:hypothetical protein